MYICDIYRGVGGYCLLGIMVGDELGQFRDQRVVGVIIGLLLMTSVVLTDIEKVIAIITITTIYVITLFVLPHLFLEHPFELLILYLIENTLLIYIPLGRSELSHHCRIAVRQ